MKKQIKPKINHDRGVFIDNVQRWFLKRNEFWTAITFVVLASVIILQFLITFLTAINPHIRLAIYPILIPQLLLFVFSIFWRNTTTAFLSLAGSMCLFAGMYYAYATKYEIIRNISSLSHPTAIHMHLQLLTAAATFYFFIGLFSAFLSVGVAFRPSFFRAKGAVTGLPYPVWSPNDDSRYKSDANGNSVLSLIAVQSLLSEVERHLTSNCKYIQVMIAGRIYFVSLDEWVPRSVTYIIRDKQSGSLIGIPKVPGGFNIW